MNVDEMLESAVKMQSIAHIGDDLGELNQIDFERFIRLLFGKLEWKANLGEASLRRNIIDDLWDWIDRSFQYKYSAFLLEKINCLFPRDVVSATEYLKNNFTSIPDLWLTKIVAGPIIRNKKSREAIIEELEKKPIEDLSDTIRKFLITDKGKYWLNPILSPSKGGNKVLQPKENSEGKSLKIAVAISGQMRGFESAFLSWEKILHGHQVDYYVSTWKKNGVSGKIDHISKTQHRFYWAGLEKEMSSIISENGDNEELIEMIMPSQEVLEESILATYGEGCIIDIQDEESLDFLKSNVEKMYYKIERCNSLIDYGKDYDLIIRIRPDLVINFKQGGVFEGGGLDLLYSILAAENERCAIFAGYGYVNAFYGFGIDDKLAIGTANLMDTYSRVYSNKTRLTPHASLADHIFESGIDAVGLFEHLDFSFADNRIPKKEEFARFLN